MTILRIFLLVSLLFSRIELDAQVIDDQPIFLDRATPKVTHLDSVQIDSFDRILANYIHAEEQIITILLNNNQKAISTRKLLVGYLRNCAILNEKRMNLLVKLTKYDYLFFPNEVLTAVGYKSTFKLNDHLMKLLSEHLLINNEFDDCNFFDVLNFDFDPRFRNANKEMIAAIKSQDRQKNINYIAALFRGQEAKFRHIAADESANDCYRENAKLILEALDKKLKK